MGADDRPNGALLYVYGNVVAGDASGELNIVDDYDHTGGAVELMINPHRAFNSTSGTPATSTFICLSGEAAATGGVGFFTTVDLADKDNLTVANGAADGAGEFCTFWDWKTAYEYLPKGQILVIPKRYVFNS
jgi:hypothetical protein